MEKFNEFNENLERVKNEEHQLCSDLMKLFKVATDIRNEAYENRDKMSMAEETMLMRLLEENIKHARELVTKSSVSEHLNGIIPLEWNFFGN